jgi:poly-gamma-glutamate capsule biosynthesis protein CapA/YwtB (metallophosphatase superfamily)
MRLALTGDVMLGRLVDRHVLADPAVDPASVWGDVLPLLRAADLRLANLECVIATGGEPWLPKVFHFRSGPRAVDALRTAGIDLVNLANNHVLDYGRAALLECLALLREAGIAYAGAGGVLQEAAAPAILRAGTQTVAVVSMGDGEPGWEAADARPGINRIEYDRHGLLEHHRARVAGSLALAHTRADLVIAGAHVGPNWGTPTSGMRALARQVIDLGADVFWGHSNHTVQGIEIYRGRPILYACGDFVDDYAVDPVDRNDRSCLFEADVEGSRVTRLLLQPVHIDRFRVCLASAEDVRWMQEWMRSRLAEFGTPFRIEGDRIVIDIPA